MKNSASSLSFSNALLTPSADLQDLPLGVLRQAQRTLRLAEPESESDSERDIDSDSEGEPEAHDIKGKRKEKVEWSAKPRTDIFKRLNKHAWV